MEDFKKYLQKFERWIIPGIAFYAINYALPRYLIEHFFAKHFNIWFRPSLTASEFLDFFPSVNTNLIPGIVIVIIIGVVVDCIRLYRWYLGYANNKKELAKATVKAFRESEQTNETDEDSAKEGNRTPMKKQTDADIHEKSCRIQDVFVKLYHPAAFKRVEEQRSHVDVIISVTNCFFILAIEIFVLTFVFFSPKLIIMLPIFSIMLLVLLIRNGWHRANQMHKKLTQYTVAELKKCFEETPNQLKNFDKTFRVG